MKNKTDLFYIITHDNNTLHVLFHAFETSCFLNILFKLLNRALILLLNNDFKHKLNLVS